MLGRYRRVKLAAPATLTTFVSPTAPQFDASFGMWLSQTERLDVPFSSDMTADEVAKRVRDALNGAGIAVKVEGSTITYPKPQRRFNARAKGER